MKRVVLLAAAAVMLLAVPVSAKEGFYIGAYYATEELSGNAGTNTKSGSGYGFRLGKGFNRYIAIEGHYSTTSHDVTGGPSFDLKSYAADLKLNFPLTSLDSAQVMTVEPYIMGGYAHYESSAAGSPKSDDVQYGIGIELYLFKELSIHVGWTKSPVSFKVNNVSRDGDVKTVDFGLIYHFI